MRDKSQGYISVHRCLQDNFIWESDEPFDRRSAWIDLLLTANWKPKRILIKGTPIDIEPGDIITSDAKLANRWNWSTKKVRNFIKVLEEEGMIKRITTKKGTTIKLVNWGFYQNMGTTEELPKNYRGTTEELSRNYRGYINNKDNKDNKENKDNNDNKQTIGSQSFLTIKDVYENNIGLLDGASMQELIKWQEEGMEVELICEAIKIANLKNKRHMKFVKGILNNWANAGTYTLADYKAKEQERKNNLSTTKKEDDNNGEQKDDEPFGTFEKMYGRDYGRFVKEGELDNLPF